MKKKEENIAKAKDALRKKDYALAKKIFEEEAEQGDVIALCNLGIMYLNGHGVNADVNKAKEFFFSASAQTSPDADYYLGIIYEKDSKSGPFQARVFFQKAALLGHKGAQYNLGRLLAQERNTLRNGIEWLLKASAEPKGHPEALCMLGRIYNSDEKLKDENKAKGFFLAAANKGDKEAQYQLACILLQEKKDEEAIDWFDKAAKQGHENAKRYLKQYEDNYRTGIESRSVPLLIKALKQILGEDYEEDLDGMVNGLWRKGPPSLKAQLFYHYQYEIYASVECIPKNKEIGIVYLYVEKDKLQYQVLTHRGLCNGTLDVEGFNLDLLKAVSFTESPPVENIREIYYRYNTSRTKCSYQVIDDKGEVQLETILVSSESKVEDTQHSLLQKITKKYCLEPKRHVALLKSKLEQQLIKNGHLEPSYEDEFSTKIQPAYAEIVAEEIKISLFFQRFTAVLESDKFKAIFENPEKFIELSSPYIPIIQQLNKEQLTLTEPLKSVVSSSQEVIDNLKSAYIGRINHANYYEVVIFIQSLHKLISEERDGKAVIEKEKIENFCQTSPYFLPSDQLQNLPAIFTAQFLTRRVIALYGLAAFFRKGHDKFEELNPVFIALEKLADMADKALPKNEGAEKDAKDNLQMINAVQVNLRKKRNKLKTICFELTKPIIILLMLEVNQVDLITILQTYASEKRKLIACLLDFKKWCQDLQYMPLVEKIGKIEKEINEKDSLASIIACITDLLVSIDTLFPKENPNESGEDKETSPVAQKQEIVSYEPKRERRPSRVSTLLDKFTTSPRQRAASLSQKIDGELSIINDNRTYALTTELFSVAPQM